MKIKNWKKFQHFKNRTPPWIKVHRELLDDRDISAISDGAFRVLINLWLLASEDKKKEGEIPCIEDIAFRLRMDKKKISKALQELVPFLDQGDIKVISKRYQGDAPEGEGEGESYSKESYSKESESEGLTDLQEIGSAIDLWNALCGRVATVRCQKLTTARKAALGRRLKDCGGIEGWEAFIEKIENNSFFHGENDRGWKANIDFALKESKFTKVMEGGFDGLRNSKGGSGNTAHERMYSGWSQGNTG